ncbi:MAG: tannase/feruloyl esterase family alpha/beta hydrolase [Burkholderiales bacterium]|nr:tannase/feruloyl esterase family alpha/beta hydrolase [Burkholderiales bacterium]
MRRALFLTATVTVAALLASCASTPRGALAGADPKAGCEGFKGLEIGAAQIVWPGQRSGSAMVTSATFHAASELVVAERAPTPAATITPAMPAHCRVQGRIAPVDPKADPIQFQVNLPLVWNGRSVQFGGGGFNGVLITGLGLVPGARYDSAAPLAQGYVTAGTDSGHANKPGVSPMAFAANEEMLLNFAYQSYAKVRNVSVELMKRAYGREPEYLYFVGSSEGGREGLTMAQRYPAAFNGVFSRVPVIHWTGLQFAGARNGAALFGEGWLAPAQVKFVHDAVLAACDAADGVADRIVSNTEACRRSFDPASLQCAAGASGANCLNPAQVRAIQTLRSPFRFPFALANGVVEYPGWGIGGEDTPAFGPTGGWRAWWTGNAAPVLPPVPANGIAWVYGAGAIRHFYARDPNADPRNVTPEAFTEWTKVMSSIMDSTSPDLGGFHARGHKLILLEHLSDYAQSPYAGLQYSESVKRHMGAGRANEFMRVYAAPGVDHVGTGAPALVDMLGALRTWVERSEAPINLQLAEQDAKPPFAVTRTRPLCEWPKWPRFKGGDANLAASFECANP